MKEKKTPLLSYAIQAALALIIAFLGARASGFTPEAEPAWICRYLSDGFFVAAVMLTGMGLLIWVSATGFFDMLRYGFSSLLVLFTPLKDPRDHKHFYEWKCEREAKRAGKPVTWSTLFVGLGCLALSLLFLALYYNLGGN